MADGCPIGTDGYRFRLELFFNPDTVRRFGSDLFGDFEFGDYATNPPTTGERWVDLSQRVTNLTFTRGLTEPSIVTATDVLDFTIVDSETAPLVEWLGDGALSSPNINAPVRLTLIDPDATEYILLTARLNQIYELHGDPQRLIEFVAYGSKTELRTLVEPQLFPAQTVDQRIQSVLTEIGYTDPVDPYPVEMFNTELVRDPEIRSGAEDRDAYFIIQEAAVSAGYWVATTSAGALTWNSLLNTDLPPLDRAVTDCATGNQGFFVLLVDATEPEPNELIDLATGDTLGLWSSWPVTTRQVWQADTQQVLNVVQLINRTPTGSGEAIDQPSVNRWGRRNTGFGFPANVANKDNLEADALAAQIVAITANRINRVSSVEFHTMRDPLWFAFIPSLEVDLSYWVHRTEPTEQAMPSSVIGYTLTVTGSHIEGTIYFSTLQETT